MTRPITWGDIDDGWLEPTNPITVEEMRAWSGAKLEDGTDVLQETINAVTDLIQTWKNTSVDQWPPRWRQGAKMLIARYLRRRNSPSGVETVGDMGVAYVSRKDPDVAQLLEIGPYRKPVAL